MASGLFRYNGKRIKKKNLIKNHFQGYSLVSNKNQVERRRHWSFRRILVAQDVEYLR